MHLQGLYLQRGEQFAKVAYQSGSQPEQLEPLHFELTAVHADKFLLQCKNECRTEVSHPQLSIHPETGKPRCSDIV